MSRPTESRAWVPVAPTWEHDPEDKEAWRRVVAMPSLAFNRVEMELFEGVGGRSVCVLGVGEGLAPLALAAMGAKVLVVDPTYSLLDLLMVRTQVVGVDIQYLAVELTDLTGVRDGSTRFCYAAQAGIQLQDLGAFYSEAFRILMPGGRFVVNEYHPFRRIWKPESGAPRIARSYFERRQEKIELDSPTPANPAGMLGRYEYHWTLSDHVHFLVSAGFDIRALEEVGEIRQRWELPNLRGLPEQLILGADKPE